MSRLVRKVKDKLSSEKGKKDKTKSKDQTQAPKTASRSTTSRHAVAHSSSGSSEWKKASDGLTGRFKNAQEKYEELKKVLEKRKMKGKGEYDLWYKETGETILSRGPPSTTPTAEEGATLGETTFGSNGNDARKWEMLNSLAEPHDESDDWRNFGAK